MHCLACTHHTARCGPRSPAVGANLQGQPHPGLINQALALVPHSFNCKHQHNMQCQVEFKASGQQVKAPRCSSALRPGQGCAPSISCVATKQSTTVCSSIAPSLASAGAQGHLQPVVASQQHAARRLDVSCQASPSPPPSSSKLVIAITGATGLVGSRLTSRLAARGHKVRVLTRNVNNAKGKLPYPGLTFFSEAQWAEAVQGADAVVNLAGEPIATRWTPELKHTIKSSRVKATKSVVDAILAAPVEKRPKVLVSSSAVGYYGNSQTASFVEDSPAGNDYLAEVCKDWEAAAKEAEVKGGVRTVILRTGIVLAPEGGALGKMLPVFQIFAGGPLGSGRQWMSWVHRDDLVALIMESLMNPAYDGVYNATAPKPVRMSELCSALGSMMGRPSWLPVPDFALQTLLGEGATVVLEGQRVLPTRTQEQGFSFKYQDVGDALKNILQN